MGSTPAKGTYSASRCAAVLGLNKYQTPREIWQKLCEENEPGFNKKHGYTLPIFEGNAATRWGNAFEEAVIKLAEQKFNNEINCREKFFSKKYGNIELTCHIDGAFKFDPDEYEPILHEGKTTNNRAFHSVKEEKQRWGEPGTDQVPEEYQVQGAIQRICTGADLVRLSVLVFPKTTEEFEELGWSIISPKKELGEYYMENGDKHQYPICWATNFQEIGNFHTYNLPKNDPLEAAIINKIQEFDANHVKTGIPPEAKDYDDIRRILTNPIGTIIATPELKKMASEYSEIVRQTGSAGPLTKRKTQLKVEIMDKIMNSKKDDWSDPPDKVILIDGDGGDVLASFSKSGFRSKRAR